MDYIGLYSTNTDGSDLHLIADGRFLAPNIVGDWVFYQNGDESYKIYAIKIDGTEKWCVG